MSAQAKRGIHDTKKSTLHPGPVCVVLGGNGFIGSHLVDMLAEAGDMEVRAFDQFGQKPQFHPSRHVKVIKGSVFDGKDLDTALEGATYVINCLSATNPYVADKDPYEDIRGLQSSVGIFERCVNAGVKKIVFISSGGAVYGRLTEIKTATELDAPMPVSPYGIAKLSTEHYLEFFKRKHNMDYVVCRLTNPYGPRQVFKKEQGVIPAFVHKISHDEPITLLGDGTSSRDFIYIEDAVKMIITTLRKQTKHPVYNIGSGKQTSLNEIIEVLTDLLGREVQINFEAAPKTFLQKTDVSIERFISEFGTPHITPFHKGISKTLSYINEQRATLLG